MEVFFIKAAQLILSLSILIVLHELGHFIPAKLFKTRVEKFYLFFNPWFSLFKFKKGETEYGLGWLPLGGYVKISGMIDESMDKEQMQSEPQPYEFRSKPAWQRLIIMIGGVTVNLLLGFFIYSMVLFTWGKERLPIANATYGVYVDSTMTSLGFEDGDRILSVGEGTIQYFGEINKEVLLNGARSFEIERAGQKMSVQLPDSVDQILLANGAKAPFAPRFQFVVDETLEGSEAARAGLQHGDRFIEIAGEPVEHIKQGMELLQDNKGNTISIVLDRGGQEVEVEAAISPEGTLGFKYQPFAGLTIDTIEYSFLASIPAGIEETGATLGGYISSLKLLGTKEGVSQIGGFGAIGSLFPSVWTAHDFWRLTAFLSLILAFMNILPIPALDGGHVLFLLYEMVSGRKPGDKFMEYAQMVGMIILFSLLLFANGNDIFKALRGFF